MHNYARPALLNTQRDTLAARTYKFNQQSQKKQKKLEDHAPRTALREKIRAQREQCGSKENLKKNTKKIKKQTKKQYSGTLLNTYG